MFLFFQSACSPVGVAASGGATTMVVAEGDRSLGTVVDDATIKLNISGKFLTSDKDLFLNIDTRVIEGRVLLTGIVDNQEIRIEAIKKVLNEYCALNFKHIKIVAKINVCSKGFGRTCVLHNRN